MYIPESLKEDFRYKRLVAQVGNELTDNIIVPGLFDILRIMLDAKRRPFNRHSVRNEKVYYYPTASEALMNRLEINDEQVLKKIRDVLTLYILKKVKVYIDQVKVEVDFRGNEVVIEHPYLRRLNPRSVVVFHVTNRSIRIELR